eukprot:Protomagalhaensia_wolfi_Nauph_80__3684@NODE_3717_length_727_cov_109_011628_g2930_i0_p1_GENE_NODE_3717_length_727_cov_109_011628_g2930_i0NODE_3717_length_727_cov_109_011628_g2930_i0_p1_ORF_typecomplete_len119_score3_26MCM6_C/PF18263_1/0_1_NODE_3717_length_727_cov_109_011628_g2930_i0173529
MSHRVELSYEVYYPAAVWMAGRIEACAEQGIPAIDHLVVKWFLTRVYPKIISRQEQKTLKQLHPRYLSVIDAMIEDRIIKVTSTSRYMNDKGKFRYLELNSDVVPGVWYLATLWAKNS